MLTIHIPSNYISERTYILDILLGEFLGLEYQIKTENESKAYMIQIENGGKLIIEDHFFSNFEDGPGYLDENNIPSKIEFVKNQFMAEVDIPVIYGDNKLSVSKDKITCGIDIFASSFLMLTRWEEYACKERDIHNRFSAYSSLSYKNNFLDRPVVNEYIEMLWNILLHLGIKQKRKERRFELILTHDVDTLRFWKDFDFFARTVGVTILKQRDFKSTLNNIKSYFQVKTGLRPDPFDTFDYLMDISEQINVKSHFFFMSGGETRLENRYSIKERQVKSRMRRIGERGHLIGFHPSYNTYNNPLLWHEEHKRLLDTFPQSIYAGRQHYLRFEVPNTWQIWEDNRMEWDSTLGFAERAGFRCGVCYPYSVFNILIRKKLGLKEKPLIVMEGSFLDYQDVSYEETKQKIWKLINTVKRYNGTFVFLWHNSSFNISRWQEFQRIYPEILTQHLV